MDPLSQLPQSNPSPRPNQPGISENPGPGVKMTESLMRMAMGLLEALGRTSRRNTEANSDTAPADDSAERPGGVKRSRTNPPHIVINSLFGTQQPSREGAKTGFLKLNDPANDRNLKPSFGADDGSDASASEHDEAEEREGPQGHV